MKEYQRIDQWLSQMGYCSRQQARTFLKKHELIFEGERLFDPSLKITHEMTLDNELPDHPLGLVLIMHKPAGYVCSQSKGEGPRIFDLLPERWQKRHLALQSVGRLDKDTTGTLILTDQGPWIHEWSHPKIHWKKTYIVEYEGVLPSETAELWASGKWVLPGEDTPCLSASLEILGPSKAKLILQEGRYHQVKRMFQALGAPVIKLHRENFGPWSAENIPPGQWQVLDFQQIPLIVSQYKEVLTK